MGRVKLKVRKLETASARQITYSKRKIGLAKKAMELSILCDVDVALLMFSPGGKPNLSVGGNKDLSDILARFSELPFEERAKRKVEILQILKKVLKKIDHDIDMQKFLGEDYRIRKAEDLQNQSRLLQALTHEKNTKLSYWDKPEEVDEMSHIIAMEERLVESLYHLQKQKVFLEEQLLTQRMAASRAQYPWLPGQQIPYERLHADPNLAIAQRDFGCYGNASGPIENIGPGSNFMYQYPYQQPAYNQMRTEHLIPGMDPNLNNPFFNQVQQSNSMGPNHDPSLY